jgi:hypothetical protein
LKKDGVAGLLYNRLMSDMISKSSLPRRERFALFIKAINYFLENKELKQLKFSSEEQNPVIRTKRVYEFENSML